MVNKVTAVSFNIIYQRQWGLIEGFRAGERWAKLHFRKIPRSLWGQGGRPTRRGLVYRPEAQRDGQGPAGERLEV